MKRCMSLAVAVLLCSVASAPVLAQSPILLFAGAGPSLPSGDFSDGADTGWMAGAGLLLGLGTGGVWVGAEGLLGRNSLKDADDVDFELLGGGALAGYTINAAGRLAPYVFGSVGMLSLKVSGFESESEVSYGVGAGLVYRLGTSASLFAAGRYLKADDLEIIPLTIGFTYLLSGAPMAMSR